MVIGWAGEMRFWVIQDWIRVRGTVVRFAGLLTEMKSV